MAGDRDLKAPLSADVHFGPIFSPMNSALKEKFRSLMRSYIQGLYHTRQTLGDTISMSLLSPKAHGYYTSQNK